MTSTEEQLLRAYPVAHGDIDSEDDDAGFGVWKAVHATRELEVEYKHVLEAGAGVAGPVSGRPIALATMSATRSCWMPWAMGRSRFRTSTWRTAPARAAGRRCPLGWCHAWGWRSMRTHYHVEQDGQPICEPVNPGDARPGRWPSGSPRSDRRPGGASCPAMGVSVGVDQAVGRRPGGPPAPRMWV